jgi:hypothetical protein
MYERAMTRVEPGCVIILIDQSGSMNEPFQQLGAKKDECAKAVNNVIRELSLACMAGDELKRRLYLAVLGYGGRKEGDDWVERVESAIPNQGAVLVGIDQLADNPLRVDEVEKRFPDGAGGLVTQTVPSPVWVDPVGSGSTPMHLALRQAGALAAAFARDNPRSFPPIVINITDGEPDDFDKAKAEARSLGAIRTDDGAALLFNVHIASSKAKPLVFPTETPGFTGKLGEFAAFLFETASPLPPFHVQAAAKVGIAAREGAVGFIFNADAEALICLLNIGTTTTDPR